MIVPEGFELVEVGAYCNSNPANGQRALVVPLGDSWCDNSPRGAVAHGDDPAERRTAWEKLYVIRPVEGA